MFSAPSLIGVAQIVPSGASEHGRGCAVPPHAAQPRGNIVAVVPDCDDVDQLEEQKALRKSVLAKCEHATKVVKFGAENEIGLVDEFGRKTLRYVVRKIKPAFPRSGHCVSVGRLATSGTRSCRAHLNRNRPSLRYCAHGRFDRWGTADVRRTNG
jgi:hypothetical protein